MKPIERTTDFFSPTNPDCADCKALGHACKAHEKPVPAHTAGPLDLHETRLPFQEDFDAVILTVVKGDTRIAEIPWSRYQSGPHPTVVTVEEARKNARLFATAGELLEALRECAEVIFGNSIADKRTADAYNNAERAIAKATGGSR